MTLIQDSLVTKDNVIANFNSEIQSIVASSIVWYNGNPGSGIPASLYSGIPAPVTTSVIPEETITSTLGSTLKSVAQLYTLVRKQRVLNYKTGNSGYGYTYDDTNIAALVPFSGDAIAVSPVVAQQPMSTTPVSYSIQPDMLISASNFNNFIAALKTEWNSLKNNVATYTYYYCHGSCHSSCHGNKGVGW